MEIFVTKVTLSSGKIVHLREPKIKDQELATRSAAGRSGGDNAYVLATAIQKEMLKLLIVDVDGKKRSAAELEDLDSLFSYRDYFELGSVVNKLTGADDLGKYQVELTKISGS